MVIRLVLEKQDANKLQLLMDTNLWIGVVSISFGVVRSRESAGPQRPSPNQIGLNQLNMTGMCTS